MHDNGRANISATTHGTIVQQCNEWGGEATSVASKTALLGVS